MQCALLQQRCDLQHERRLHRSGLAAASGGSGRCWLLGLLRPLQHAQQLAKQLLLAARCRSRL